MHAKLNKQTTPTVTTNSHKVRCHVEMNVKNILNPAKVTLKLRNWVTCTSSVISDQISNDNRN